MKQYFTDQAREYFSNRDTWILSSPINRDLYVQVSEILSNKQDKKEKCSLFLTTYGGDPDAAFRIARAFKHYYPSPNSFRIVICGFCKSAGTLIAIGADELSIGDMGELGPLDVQVSKSNEFVERVSGLEIQESLESIHKHAHEIFRSCLVDIKIGTRVSMKMAGEFASLLATGMVNPLYAQIDPNRIGELNRAMKVASYYGRQLNEKTKNLKDGALEKIISGYPSHSFVIDRKESSSLFNRVDNLSPTENLIFHLFKDGGLISQNNNITFIELPSEEIFDVIDKNFIDESIEESQNEANATESESDIDPEATTVSGKKESGQRENRRANRKDCAESAKS